MSDAPKTLSSLGLTAQAGRNPQVTGLAVDSREVQEGFLFAAMPGAKMHGGEFIRFALRMGAAAILTDGSAVLGLCNIGPAAAMPVMEGKAALFKAFAGVDAWPI